MTQLKYMVIVSTYCQFEKYERWATCPHVRHYVTGLGRASPWHKWCCIHKGFVAPNLNREGWKWGTIYRERKSPWGTNGDGESERKRKNFLFFNIRYAYKHRWPDFGLGPANGGPNFLDRKFFALTMTNEDDTKQNKPCGDGLFCDVCMTHPIKTLWMVFHYTHTQQQQQQKTGRRERAYTNSFSTCVLWNIYRTLARTDPLERCTGASQVNGNKLKVFILFRGPN